MDFYRTYAQIVGTLSPLSKKLTRKAEKLIERLSYSHFELLAAIDSPQKLTFYEIESVRWTWSVDETFLSTFSTKLGAVQQVSLLERRDLGDDRIHTNEVRYPTDVPIVTLRIAADGKRPKDCLDRGDLRGLLQVLAHGRVVPGDEVVRAVEDEVDPAGQLICEVPGVVKHGALTGQDVVVAWPLPIVHSVRPYNAVDLVLAGDSIHLDAGLLIVV
jgi:hypothetical protein